MWNGKRRFYESKKNSSDEFLVEKKSPLVMPPDFNELPFPKEQNVNNEKNEDKIKKLISSNEADKIDNNTEEKNRTIEDSLLKRIKEN